MARDSTASTISACKYAGSGRRAKVCALSIQDPSVCSAAEPPHFSRSVRRRQEVEDAQIIRTDREFWIILALVCLPYSPQHSEEQVFAVGLGNDPSTCTGCANEYVGKGGL